MKKKSVFISVSRIETIDYKVLFHKALDNNSFYVCLDIDIQDIIVNKMPHSPNVIVTPHIAGGTVDTRKRMFKELAEQIVADVKKEKILCVQL